MLTTDVTALLTDTWRRLEAQAARHGASLTLRPGATEKAVAAAEKKMKLVFPPGYRASLLLHDGQEAFAEGGGAFPWMAGCPPLAPLDRLVSQWKDLQELAEEYPAPDAFEHGDRVKAGPYRTRIVPIAGTPWWDGDTTYLDLDPGPKGAAGQLITMVTECDFVALGPSFEAALARWADALESGDWVFDAARGAEYPAGAEPYQAHPADLFAGP